VGDLRQAVQSRRIDRAFAERVMLAVTQVNGCRYCSFAHTRMALTAGVTSEEIRAIEANEFGKILPDQVTALMFAQHYAEMDGHPAPEAWQRMIDVYGADVTRDLMVYIRLISLANLWGNTFDALLSRLTVRAAPGSSLLQELGVVFGWIVLVPTGIARRLFFRQHAPTARVFDWPASIR
jgi:AhpD family alkylhydroperoxidase